ncbi:hypothetical protein CPB84DRAFT_1669268 [Gymnopilus junonius]|uniref:UBC core domain-containing protein n=1 Tax=Gymnopilus junonius TaxID=109634 RepID=A0A9P5NYJ9_GYMJU|nr:hypothetical protein CPB84DRAFT_1669268 [Gymnopilus junonius]
MSESDVQQLVEMGATPAQARAALKQYKDVMQAAECFFEGKFDHIKEENVESSMENRRARPATPTDDDEDMNSDEEQEDEADVDNYVDYDSDFEQMNGISGNAAGNANVDPYAGIFFSKDRKEEVIEVEEVPEIMVIDETKETVPLLTQGQWMKGCPEGGEQSFLFSLYSQLSTPSAPCPQDCGASIPRIKGDFFGLHPDFAVYIDRLRSRVTKICPRCHSKVCLACGEPVSVDHEKHVSTGEDPLFHCSNLQGVILGVGLTMLEELFNEQNQDQLDIADPSMRNTKRRKTDGTALDVDDEDVLYYANVVGKKAKGGTGYAGDVTEDTTGQLKALAAQRAKDEKIAKLLSFIRLFLPNLNREGGGRTSDYLVHPTTLAHLRRRFNHICSSLLRNDSLADMSDRSILYFELLEWLETISNHEALASMMAMPIMVVSLVKAVNAKNNQIRERTIVYEGSSGPRELLEGIAIQAQAALKGLEGNKVPETRPEELTEEQKRMTIDTKEKAEEEIVAPISDENLKLIRFCRRILSTVKAIDRSLRDTKGDAFVDRLHSSLPRITSSTSPTKYRMDPGASEAVVQQSYLDWATRTRFEYCDLTIPVVGEDDADITPHYKFYYDNEARMLANSDIPKRSLAIAKELAILTTNLPVSWGSSIFLRVDETRVDIIKALITGPEGTPSVFQSVTFLFDIFLGPSYNQSPPSVKYMTTNGGKFRFNPNLYADGKVCLSLLGTWQGPGWVSGKSTLLQVLISIQSMILCDEPYLNEPAWASSSGTPQSQAYSANVRRMVVKTAMLGNLKSPPEPFADIVHTHFRVKARSISSQLDRWLSMDDGKQLTADGGVYPGNAKSEGSASFAKDIEELKKLLKKLEG